MGKIGALLVAVALGTTPALAQPTSVDVNLENWMAELPGVADLPLTKLPIPGTHDSGSYSISKHSPWALTGKGDFGKLTKLPGFAVKPTAAAWSRTQDKAIFWQLADGIRSVDLRLSNEPDGKIYIEHGLRGAEIGEVLDDVAKFAFTHPKELVLVHLARFTGFTPAAHDALLRSVRAKLGARLVPDSLGTSVTLRQLWAIDKNVVVLHADASIANDPANADIWSDDVLYGPWANVQKNDDLLKANHDALAARDPAKIWQLAGTLTPDTKMIVKGLFDLGPESIEDLMKTVHPAVQSWLRHDFTGSVNLVMTDWYDARWDGGSSFVREVLSTVDGEHPLVPFGLAKTGSGQFFKHFLFHTWADFAWEAVPGATEYEIKLDAVSFLRNSTSQHSTTTSVHIERTNLPWTDPITKGTTYDVSVRARVNGVWHDWSMPKRIKL